VSECSPFLFIFILKEGNSIFDISVINKRYFDIKIGDLTLEVEPPKIKTLKKIMSLSKSRSEETMNDLAEAVHVILNKNKSGYVVASEIVDELDLDQLNEILTAYFEWLSKEKSSKN